MTSRVQIDVRYPLSEGRISLRIDEDWATPIEANAVSDDGSSHRFVIESKRPFFYFKPVLATEKTFEWAEGNNYLVLPRSQTERVVYPHFQKNSRTLHERIEIRASELDEVHAIRVFTPPGYTENTLKHYPVLYMQDGHNLFLPTESFAGETWDVERTLTILDSMNLIRKTIVVGVYPNDRMREYTSEGYETYGRYLVDDVKPIIDRAYRTLPHASDTAVMGSSLGGVVSFYLGWQWPEVFGRVGAMSSTFGYRDDLFERVASEARPPIGIYLDSGWPGDNYEVTRAMYELLLVRGFEPGRDVLYHAYPEGVHNERSWAMRAHIPFQFFFAEVPR